MATYPDPLTTGTSFRTPLVRKLEFQTGIARGLDTTEQRWAITPGDESFQLLYQDLSTTERNQLLTFLESTKGPFDDTWDFVFQGVTFSHCYFDFDKIDFLEQAVTGLSTAKIGIRQKRRAADTGTLGTFPVLASGARMMLPYTHGRTWDVVAVRTEQNRSAWYNRSTGLRSWTVGGPTLIDADAQALWDHFRRARGKLTTFTMTDPDSGSTYPSCRYGSDSLEWQYNGPRNNQILTTVEQFA